MFNLRNQTVTVSRESLIEALHDNLSLHKAEYQEAMSDYRAKVIADLKAALARAEAGDFEKVNVHVSQPESHEQEFQDVIGMLEMSVDETITLDSDAFKAYFRNEWPRKRQFELIAASYKS